MLPLLIGKINDYYNYYKDACRQHDIYVGSGLAYFKWNESLYAAFDSPKW